MFITQFLNYVEWRNKMSNGNYCNINCRYFRETFEMMDNEEREVSYCDLGNSEIYNRNFCEDYEE